MDIDLEEEEDSSDEEYCPEEQEEDDTAEEVSSPSVLLGWVVVRCLDSLPPPVCAQTFPSDGDSLSSPPRMHQGSQAQCVNGQQEESLQVLLTVPVSHSGLDNAVLQHLQKNQQKPPGGRC